MGQVIPNTKEYWSTFYTIQSLLLLEAPEKYTPEDSKRELNTPLNSLSHKLALEISGYYEKV